MKSALRTSATIRCSESSRCSRTRSARWAGPPPPPCSRASPRRATSVDGAGGGGATAGSPPRRATAPPARSAPPAARPPRRAAPTTRGAGAPASADTLPSSGRTASPTSADTIATFSSPFPSCNAACPPKTRLKPSVGDNRARSIRMAPRASNPRVCATPSASAVSAATTKGAASTRARMPRPAARAAPAVAPVRCRGQRGPKVRQEPRRASGPLGDQRRDSRQQGCRRCEVTAVGDLAPPARLIEATRRRRFGGLPRAGHPPPPSLTYFCLLGRRRRGRAALFPRAHHLLHQRRIHRLRRLGDGLLGPLADRRELDLDRAFDVGFVFCSDSIFTSPSGNTFSLIQ